MPRKAAPPAEGADIPEPRRSGRLASTTSAVVDTAKDAVKTVKKATAASKKRSGDVNEDVDVKEAKKSKTSPTITPTTNTDPSSPSMTETIAPGTDADPPTAKLSPMAVGDTLPSFVLKNEKDEDVDVKSLTEDKGLVLFLVPKADTPGCTTQACGFRDIYPDFTSLGFNVYCLSADTPAAQMKWQTKKTLPYPLLSDRKRLLIGALGAADGAKTKRSHFVFGKGGVLLDKRMPVKPADSPRLALEFVKSHAGSASTAS